MPFEGGTLVEGFSLDGRLNADTVAALLPSSDK